MKYKWRITHLLTVITYIDCTVGGETLFFFFEWKPYSGTLAPSSTLFGFGEDYE